MILDRLENSQKYAAISPRLAQALQHMQQTDFAQLAAGRYELDGTNLFYLVQDYTPKEIAAGVAESHRAYIDIQYILRGEEFIGYADISRMQLGEFKPEKDFQAMTGVMDLVRVPAGSFMILYPNDAHMPGLNAGVPGMVRKVVFKVKID